MPGSPAVSLTVNRSLPSPQSHVVVRSGTTETHLAVLTPAGTVSLGNGSDPSWVSVLQQQDGREALAACWLYSYFFCSTAASPGNVLTTLCSSCCTVLRIGVALVPLSTSTSTSTSVGHSHCPRAAADLCISPPGCT